MLAVRAYQLGVMLGGGLLPLLLERRAMAGRSDELMLRPTFKPRLQKRALGDPPPPATLRARRSRPGGGESV